MVLGFAIEIKPIEQTPLESYDNVNPHVMREPEREEVRAPRPNPFMRPPMDMPMPPRGFDPRNIPPHVREKIERDLGIGEEREPQPRPHRPIMHNERPMTRHEETPSSPFAMMGRNELVKIITKHLWDSEIDIENASNHALVRFLEEKDKRMQAAKRRESEEREIRELENDPKVANFINKMKDTYKKNPQFRSYVKNFLGNLDEE